MSPRAHVRVLVSGSPRFQSDGVPFLPETVEESMQQFPMPSLQSVDAGCATRGLEASAKKSRVRPASSLEDDGALKIRLLVSSIQCFEQRTRFTYAPTGHITASFTGTCNKDGFRDNDLSAWDCGPSPHLKQQCWQILSPSKLRPNGLYLGKTTQVKTARSGHATVRRETETNAPRIDVGRIVSRSFINVRAYPRYASGE